MQFKTSLLSFFALVSATHAAELSGDALKKEIFNNDIKSFEAKYHKKMKGSWTSKYKSSYRTSLIYFHEPTKQRYPMPPHTLFGNEMTEIVYRVKNNKINQLMYSVYNRGDDTGEKVNFKTRSIDKVEKLTIEQFKKKVASLQKQLSEKLQVPMRKEKFGGILSKESYFWYKDERLFRLDVSTLGKAQDLTPDYITFTVEDRRGGLGSEPFLRPRAIPSKQLMAKIKKENGDVYINKFPMVDQGQKGYCVCATVARILNHYGRTVNQHEIAKAASSTAEKGTTLEDIIKSVKLLRAGLKLNFREIYSLDKSAKELSIAYKNANKKKMPTILRKTGWKKLPTDFHLIVMANVDKEGYLETLSKHNLLRKFKKDIIKHIDKGIPVGWIMILGLYPEDGKTPQSGGGHMRTIIGYNKKDDSLIFSDSWGKSHELKKMKFVHAMAATRSLQIIEPRK